MRDTKFKFLYKGLPFSGMSRGFNWFSKIYHLDQMINKSLSELSDVHGSCELVAKLQYTGLQDKDGVDIYEGDIVAWGCIDDPVIELVKYNYSHCGFDTETSMLDPVMWIIGNIYQNPELLEALK